MKLRKEILLGVAVALMFTPAVSAQRRTAPAKTAEVGAAIALQVGGQPYRFEGNAACTHAPIASIYGVAAEMWSVQQSDGQRSIALTLWHPQSTSGDMFSLNVRTGGKSYVVNTVKAGGARAVQGSGKVTLTNSGAGGTFTINATATDGAAITGTLKCGSFTAAVAEGG